MKELGYVEGQNFTMDYIDLQGLTDRYAAAMQQLVERKADILIVFGPEQALKSACRNQDDPNCHGAIDYDPFALGYVTSLARPTSNVTGIFLDRSSFRPSACKS